MNCFELREEMKNVISNKIAEKVKSDLNSADQNVDVKEQKNELLKEISVIKQYVNSAKNSKKIYSDLLKQRPEPHPDDLQDMQKNFEELRRAYAKQVEVRGKLESQLKQVKREFNAAKNANARVREEIQHTKGRENFYGKNNGNPWQVGVPYGGGRRPPRYRN